MQFKFPTYLFSAHLLNWCEKGLSMEAVYRHRKMPRMFFSNLGDLISAQPNLILAMSLQSMLVAIHIPTKNVFIFFHHP